MIKRLLLICLVFLLMGCTEGPKEEYIGTEVSVDPSSIITMMKQKEDMFLVVTLSSCPVCAEYLKVLDELVKNYEVVVYHIVIDEYEDQYDELSQDYLDNLTDAPDSFFIVDGKIEDERVGFIQYRNLVDLLKENGLVEKND
ncbi:MAG: thioredoxin family protein [Erysipelotrichaceae bacterium]|nr:thioredoxin family protein [Erysipelotrichaceae bacterium]